MDQWLVRTSKNTIAGPYSKEHVRQMIVLGELGITDEVCQANNYWISLHERDEIQRAFGDEALRSLTKRGKAGGSGVHSDDESTDPDITSQRLHGIGSHTESLKQYEASNQSDTTAVIDIQKLKANQQGGPQANQQNATPPMGTTIAPSQSSSSKTKVIQAKPKRTHHSVPAGSIPQIEIIGHVERPLIWRVFIWLLVAASGFVVFLILRFFKMAD